MRRFASGLCWGLVACSTTYPGVPVPDDAPADAAPGAALPDCAGTSVLVGAVANARDLGGISGANGPIQCGQLYRSAAPANLSSEGCASMEMLGIATVIDLRVEEEREARPDAACLTAQAELLLAPLPIPYGVSPAEYVADFESDESIRRIFDQLADPAAYPLLFHCTYGRDRTGVVTALILLALGVSREAIMADYQRTAESGLSITPGSLSAVLDEVASRGGIEAHLAALGVSPAALATLRSRMWRDGAL